jgi:hypothetical protein
MKHMKIMLLSIISMIIASTSSLINASLSDLGKGTSGLVGQARKGGGLGFELYNKSLNTITLTIFINDKFLRWINIEPSKKHEQNIDLDIPVSIGIYDPATAATIRGNSPQNITPVPNHFYNLNAPGKTKYITWNPAKSPSLYPQTGIWMGILGKSDTGYSLSNNLSQGQISGH